MSAPSATMPSQPVLLYVIRWQVQGVLCLRSIVFVLTGLAFFSGSGWVGVGSGGAIRSFQECFIYVEPDTRFRDICINVDPI